MKINSKYLIFLIIICILFSISAVSASEVVADSIDADNSYHSSIDLNQDLESDDANQNLKSNYVNQDLESNDVISESESISDSDSLQDSNDLNQDISTNDLSEDLGETAYSFDNLSEDIKNCGGTLNMEHDYVRSESDKGESLFYNLNSLVINGNNHVFDGASSSGFIFQLPEDETSDIALFNLTINDLTFRNFNETALSVINGNVTLNNVTFENCNASVGCVVAFRFSEAVLNNVHFFSEAIDDLVFAEESRLTVNNTIYNGNGFKHSFIFVKHGSLIVENSIFENSSSVQGGLINFKGDYMALRNSRFMNARADFTGGGIIAKYFPASESVDGSPKPIPSDAMLIENCIFSNLSSSSNGGAIYLDLDSGSEHIPQTLNIINSNFTDCHSKFGGVIVILGGSLNVNGSNLINSSADFEGGAIFSSFTDVSIYDSNLTNNVGGENAGALYFNMGKLTINGSNIIGNKALKESEKTANSIYAYDVDAHFANSVFDNGGISVYADFASNSSLENIEKNEDIFLLDNHNYIVSVESKGIKLNLTKNEIIADKLPLRFDLRDWGWVSPVKLQGDNDDCWAFATAASLESSLLKSTGVLYNISENYIQKLQLKYFVTGDLRISLTGFAYSGLGYALSWYGVLPSDNGYDDRGMAADTDLEVPRIHLQDAIIILPGSDPNETSRLIKEAILKYGPVTVQKMLNGEPADVDFSDGIIDYMDHGIHFISIIGWDDNYNGSSASGNGSSDKDDSNPFGDDANPFGDDSGSGGDSIDEGSNPSGGEGDNDEDYEPPVGAWIVKDSLEGFAYYGYFDVGLLVVDNYAIVPQNPAICYIFENVNDYHVNYQTDLTGLTGFDENYTYYSNEFTSKYDELIGAVGTYFNEYGVDYSFDIFVNGVKVHSQSGVSEFSGFRTIVLDKYIPIKTGDQFKVVFKSNSVPYQAWSRVHYLNNTSLVSADGNSWIDFAPLNKTVCLKVYTVADDSKIADNNDIAVDYDGGSYFSVRVVTADGRAVGAGESVSFTINGKTITVKTDYDGYAKVLISELPGTYTITTAYRGQSYQNTVTVKQVLTTSQVSIKNTDKNIVLKATLKINGKPVQGKVIKFTFRGKTYSAKTNKDGVAQVTIKQSVFKNLKGKSYAVKIAYGNDVIKSSVKIKQFLKVNKATVKKNAKKFYLKATLMLNGKAAKGKVIKFTFRGKTYKAKTNKKGLAKVAIKRKVIKKLKKGKSYAVKVAYGNDYVKTAVKVKR